MMTSPTAASLTGNNNEESVKTDNEDEEETESSSDTEQDLKIESDFKKSESDD